MADVETPLGSQPPDNPLPAGSQVPAPLVVNKGELARLFRVSTPTVDGWIAKGCPVRAGGSNGVPYEFDVAQVKAWRDQVEAEERKAEDERRQRLGIAQAEMFAGERLAPEGIDNIREVLEAERLAVIVGKQKGELLSRDEVRADYAAVFGVVRQHTLGWAATLGRVANLTAEQQQEAERLVRAMLVSMHGQIKDPAMRPALADGEAR